MKITVESKALSLFNAVSLMNSDM